jgi:Fe-S-cluster-containing dehydrogenase component
MTIDLNACVGCASCVIACSVENNVPTVGKEEVLNGREMHWMRIDRYYSGSPDNPDCAQQPVACQNCEDAPCESVCPVLATVHNSEGLNLQVYNRCVGTRYCSNNCPYKNRHFNFYEYSGSYAHGRYSALRGSPLELALNPRVTVRSKGVMEKCTFCVQRINAAHVRSQMLGRPIEDGDLQTACQQTCPTQAITFGNINNAAAEVMQARAGHNAARSYRLLEHLNTQPTVAYLARIRNRQEPLGTTDSPDSNQSGYASAHEPDGNENA